MQQFKKLTFLNQQTGNLTVRWFRELPDHSGYTPIDISQVPAELLEQCCDGCGQAVADIQAANMQPVIETITASYTVPENSMFCWISNQGVTAGGGDGEINTATVNGQPLDVGRTLPFRAMLDSSGNVMKKLPQFNIEANGNLIWLTFAL